MGTSNKLASPPRSLNKARRGGAAYTITGECERLFCETLKAVFLGEGNLALQDSLVLGMQYDNDFATDENHDHLGRPVNVDRSRPDGFVERRGMVEQWIEVWDYKGGTRFRGFVAEQGDEKVLFVFFDEGVVTDDLKPGITALLELGGIPEFDCTRLVACLDRRTDADDQKALAKDLGWVGFEPTTLADWTDGKAVSDRWLFLGIDI